MGQMLYHDCLTTSPIERRVYEPNQLERLVITTAIDVAENSGNRGFAFEMTGLQNIDFDCRKHE